jgi:RimJ/RimL family protein N-acetyltransferase
MTIKITKFPNNLDGFYVISCIEDSKPIGFFGIKGNEVVGLYIEEEYRNKGYGKEVIDLIKNNLDAYFITNTSNTTMQHILEELGYTKYLKYEVKK